MNRHIFIGITGLLVLTAVCFFWGANQTIANTQTSVGTQTPTDIQTAIEESHKTAYQRRLEANKRLQEAIGTQQPQQTTQAVVATPKKAIKTAGGPLVTYPSGINPAVNVTLPNYANSPNIRKFVDSLPGLGWANRNNLGQYIPIANPDTNTYPGSDYYEIGLVDHNEQMNSDLPATQIRGYYQINTTDPNVAAPHYLGPLIIAQKDRPVRLKFVNQLGINGAGDLPLPVDTTIMGAGMGAILNADGSLPMTTPMPTAPYTQNRANIHLHGGLTPWISDGTPHQWITPAGDSTVQKKGVSFQNVPDMVGAGKSIPAPAAGDGMGTYYYPNQQSARLMFYHDHSYGITRLNVYAGEAAGYIVTDPVEEDLISVKKVLPDLGGVYHYGIPLVIQDKTFVNDTNTPPGPRFPRGYTPTPKTINVDPLWYTYVPRTKGGNLWIGHEYMPNENIYDLNGYNDKGRWDYGPWMSPPWIVTNNTLPSPTIIPEAFQDTMVVNGCAFPYVELPPTAVRFRILNACNDRMLNLQLYLADPRKPTEVKMVPAVPNPRFPATWPTDGRAGGVPDPCKAGPTMYQIGNECGFLAQVAEIPPHPINFDYNRRSITFGSVTSKALLLPPAVRADIVVDLSAYAGKTLILYNDAPAPMPLYDTRYDYFTDCPDQTAIGGAPSIPPGFGPNTRTVMQIRVLATAHSPTYDVNSLKTALPKAFAAGQDHPLVPQTAYNAAYPGLATNNIYANVADGTLNITGATSSVAKVVTNPQLPGLGYTSPPTVSLVGGGIGGGTPGTPGNPGVAATATATLNGVIDITLVTAGSGYTSAPTVTITAAPGDTGTGATAVATISGGVVTVVTVTNSGSNYLVAPTVTFTGGGAGATQATAQANTTLGSVGAINITNPGSGYIKAPLVYITGGGVTSALNVASATAMLNGDIVLDGKNLVEGFDMDYGRMNAILGSTPNPLTPAVGNGPTPGASYYVDPPTELLADGNTILWRISHVGVDSHSIHFHLFNVQVVNRVDWTNTIKPPYPEELGWKETIRTNPFEDIIVAIKPVHMTLPFDIPDSNRLLDPTGMAVFQFVQPQIGLPTVAQTINIMTNFGWEYVWHCHLLGHEENDMMRPMIMTDVNNYVTPVSAPRDLTADVNTTQRIHLAWADDSNNETGFRIERAIEPNAFAEVNTTEVNVTDYNDAPLAASTTYTYRVIAFNSDGNSLPSNTVMITMAAPAVPSNLAATASAAGISPRTVRLTWADNSNNEAGFTIQRATNSGFTKGLTTFTVGANTTTYTDSPVIAKKKYYYKIRAFNAIGDSAYVKPVRVTTLP
jgi:FtsP/CotA-like multicopper oxidase with cupredoxin domain